MPSPKNLVPIDANGLQAENVLYVELNEASAPSTPASGKVRLYTKTDGKVYIKDDAGTETDITTAGGSSKGTIRILSSVPPATLYATPDVRPGGSTPAENFPCWDFDDATDEYMDFLCRLEGYAGGGLTFTLAFAMTSATSGNVRLGVAIRRFADDAEDMDASHTYDYNEATAAVASATGEVKYADITFTHGTDMDDWATGELAMVRVRREPSDTGNDTATGDMELLSVYGRET